MFDANDLAVSPGTTLYDRLGRDGKRRCGRPTPGEARRALAHPACRWRRRSTSQLGVCRRRRCGAFARLQLAAVVARWHLAAQHPAGWPGFIALGPTRTGKTSIASLVSRVYRPEEARAIRLAQHETPGVVVRASPARPCKPDGLSRRALSGTRVAYLCIDEYDKSPREVRAAAGALLLGASVAELEGKLVTVRPTVYVTLNTGRGGLGALHEATSSARS